MTTAHPAPTRTIANLRFTERVRKCVNCGGDGYLVGRVRCWTCDGAGVTAYLEQVTERSDDEDTV